MKTRHSTIHAKTPRVQVIGLAADGSIETTEADSAEITGKLGDIDALKDTLCVAFITSGARIENPQGLLRWFHDDRRLVAVALRRLDPAGGVLPSVSLAPRRGTLMRRGIFTSDPWTLPGPPVKGFRHDRALSVEAVHPRAWAVRTRAWIDSGPTELPWEYAVQWFIDRVTAGGEEVFFVPEVIVHETEFGDRRRHDLEALQGLFDYVRKRWGPGRARLFRWGFKPLLLGSRVVGLPVRLLRREGPTLRPGEALRFISAR